MKNNLHFGELFSGPGGLSLGAKLASQNIGVEILHEWAIDWDIDACKTYKFNISTVKTNVICDDIRRVDFDTLNKIDILAFGFPCNDFSIVGEQKGLKGQYGPLYLYCAKALDVLRPVCFVAENVSGLQNANDGKAMQTILESFAKSGDGYNLSVHLYKAEEYGVPQKRRRIIIVGFSNSSNLQFYPPKATHLIPVSVKEALSGIQEDAHNHEFSIPSSKVAQRLSFIPPGGNAWSETVPDQLKIKTKAKLSQIYKRLDPEKPSYTITGSGGGGTHVYHWSELRALTNRERARIQSFPDNYVFCGTKESVRKQIGMAVPPLLSKAIFEALLKTLLGQKYDHVSNNIAFERGGLFDAIK